MRMQCPHCEGYAYTRTSLALTNTSRETIFQCRTLDCGHVFSAVTEINRTITPSARPNPRVILPMSRHAAAAIARAMETAPDAADSLDFELHKHLDAMGNTSPERAAARRSRHNIRDNELPAQPGPQAPATADH